MAVFSVHKVVKIELSAIREHDTFSTRTIIITDEQGNQHEVSMFSNSDDEDALKVML
jgi:hypothetical protein